MGGADGIESQKGDVPDERKVVGSEEKG